jgi:hypothetical protein
VREQVREEVSLLKDKTEIAAEKCLKLKAEINQLVIDIADVVTQMLETSNETGPAQPRTGLHGCSLSAYAGMSLRYWL